MGWDGWMGWLGKPLFEMFGFYVGISQIALESPPLCQMGERGKKVPQTILASLYTPSALTGNAHIKPTHFKKGLP